MSKPSQSGLKDISRIKQKNNLGWLVRVKFGDKYTSRFFSDKKHGRNAGRRLAISFRDTVSRSFGKPVTNRVVFAKSRSSSSPVLGVRKVSIKNRSYFVVTWQEDQKKQKYRYFNIGKMSEKTALVQASKFARSVRAKIYEK